MILYSPITGDAACNPVNWQPQSCFLMIQLGQPAPKVITEVRASLERVMLKHSVSLIDANSETTGKDFLDKITSMAYTVPMGIAIVHEGISTKTMANIFYELGLMQAYGKETLVIKVGNAEIPSDFVRTEYLEYNKRDFVRKMNAFMAAMRKRANYYCQMAEILERNPLLSIDYLRRSYLLTGEESCRMKAQAIFNESGLEGRARNSVENMLTKF